MTGRRLVVLICVSCVLIFTCHEAARTKRSYYNEYPVYNESALENITTEDHTLGSLAADLKFYTTTADPQITITTAATTTTPTTTPPPILTTTTTTTTTSTTTTPTATPPPTKSAATTTTTTERVLTESELEAIAILNETRAKLDTSKIQLYKHKTKLNLKFVNSAISHLLSIQRNLTELLNSESEAKPNGGGSSASKLSFSSYKQRDDALENEVLAVERSFVSHRQRVQRYSVELNNVEQSLGIFHSTLGNILQSGLSRTQADENLLDRSGTGTGTASEDSGSIVDPECGGIVEAESSSGSGFIQYRQKDHRFTRIRPGQFQAQTGQSCLWIMTASQTGLRAGSAQKKIQVDLIEDDFLSSMTGSLSVGYFAGAAYDTPDSLKWTSFNHNQYSSARVVIPAPVAYLHFVPISNIMTGQGQGAGFKLNFQVSDQSQGYGAPTQTRNFKNFFVSVDRDGSITYPSEGTERVLSNERTSIVLQPSSRNSRLFMKWLALDTKEKTKDFKSAINIYSFNSQLNPLPQEWSRIDELTGSWNVNETQDFISSYDFFPNPSKTENPLILIHPILLTYNYESSSLSPSFEFFWKTLSPTENSILASNENSKRARIFLYTSTNHQGRSKYWELYNDECVSVVPFLQRGEGVKSLTTKDTCVKVCDRVDCGGTCHIMKPGTRGHGDTAEINFQDRIRSIQAC